MRARPATLMVLLALASCKGRALPSAPDAAPAPSASAAPPPAPSGSISNRLKPTVGAAEQVPGDPNRFYIDQERFSVVFPAFPIARFQPPMTTMLEATGPKGEGYAAICLPTAKKAADLFPEARVKALGNGKLLSETHPTFAGGEAYELHAKLDDGSERVMRWVLASARLCTISAEIPSGDDQSKALDFVQSFRREPAQ